MINKCVMIYPYYRNPGMLEFQVKNWNQYPDELHDHVRIVVIDDGSPEPAAPILKHCRLATRCYRVSVNIPFNMHEARNIGAHEASSDDGWLFMSDIDIVLPAAQAHRMLSKNLDPGCFYTFERVFASTGERKVHPNTFLVRRSAYWQVNGYDLDLTAHGIGGYGGDGEFVSQLRKIAPRQHLHDVTLIGFGRSSRSGQPAIPDADTVDLDREAWRVKFKEAVARKAATGNIRSVNPIRSPYERVL